MFCETFSFVKWATLYLALHHPDPTLSCEGAHVVIVSSDLHILATTATADYTYGGRSDAYNPQVGPGLLSIVSRAVCLL